MLPLYGPSAATVVLFQQARDKEVDGDHVPPRGRENAFGILWVVIGIVLLLLSLYLWYLVKRRQVANEQLEILASELKVLFDSAPCGYHAVDDQGYFTSANQRLLHWLGYSKDELIGKLRFTDIVEEKHVPLAGNTAALLNGNVEVAIKKKDGGTLPVVLSAIEKPGPGHRQSRLLYSTIDNSKCRDAMNKMEKLDQELEAFSYSISHDLRAPLRSIDGYSRILQEDYTAKLDDEGKRVLNVIMNNARRMGALIDDLLEYGRLGRKNIHRSNVNMAGIVRNVIDELMRKEPERKVEWIVGELHAAFADADMMRQVWVNILDNALKYTGKKAVAAIEVRSYPTEHREICYEVSDNGEGFDMKYVGKLFGVFQRLHKIQEFAGTGVGLAIVKRIISRHGGSVRAEAAVNAGAVFYFTIPFENENL